MKKSFTMIELIFVIVILGILAAVAIPKLAATRDDATITKVRGDVSSVRSAIATVHTKNLMKGDNSYPDTLDDNNGKLFSKVLTYPIYSKNADGHWIQTDDTKYKVKIMNNDIEFDYDSSNGHFDCNGLNSGEANTLCATLTH